MTEVTDTPRGALAFALTNMIHGDREFRLDASAELIRRLAGVGYSVARTEQLPKMRHARRDDPDTSWEAAVITEADLKANQRAVLHVMRLLAEPVTDEALIDWYNHFREGNGLPGQSESGIRTRRAELVRAGFLRHEGFDRISTGGRAMTHVVVQ